MRRRDFWHALLIYTTGEIVARHLDSYTPYPVRDGLYDRSWTGALPVFEKDWKPYLAGKTDRAAAVRKLLEDYNVASRK